MSATEILDILKVCRETGVTNFDYGPLSVSFGKPAPREVFDPRIPPHWYDRPANRHDAPLTPAAATLVEPDHDKTNAETLELEELRAREHQLEELLITDPEAAEEMLTRGELGPDDRGITETT